MGSTQLYLEGLAEFRNAVEDKLGKEKSKPNDRTRDLLREFLEERSTPLEAKNQADDLREDTERKYGNKKGPIPKEWISNILGNINRFIDIGNYVMKGSPETVGMAWMVAKLTLSAIQNNYELYGLFGDGLTTVTEVMTIIPHYDRLYDERASPDYEASEFMDKLFSDLKGCYASVLLFCFAIKKHIKAKKGERFVHGVKDFFGAEKPDFQDKLDTMNKLKDKVLQGSNGAFQKGVFDRFTSLSKVVDSLKKDLNGISDFSGMASRLREQQQAILDKVEKSEARIIDNIDKSEFRVIDRIETSKFQIIEAVKDISRAKTPWDFAEERHDKHLKKLNPMPLKEAEKAFDNGRYIRKDQKTCLWVQENDTFRSWVDGSSWSKILLVVGKAGSGKTVAASAMLDQIAKSEPRDRIVLCVSGSMAINGEVGEDSPRSLIRVAATLMGQLYEIVHLLAEADDHNAEMLNKCIDASNNPKAEKTNKTNQLTKHDDPPSLSDLGRLKRILASMTKTVYIVIDAADNMDQPDQTQLFDILNDLTRTSGKNPNEIVIAALVTCGDNSHFFSHMQKSNYCPSIYMHEENRVDMETVLDATMDDTPTQSPEIREEAKLKILQRANSRFNYLQEVAIPYLRLPYQGSILDHLKELPDTASDTYAQSVQSLDQGSLGMLRSALSLTLYSNRAYFKVQEVLDMFTGVYLPPVESSKQPGSAAATAAPPAPSRLQIEQLKRATEPFSFKTHEYDGTPPLLELEDRIQVREFCSLSKDPEESEHDTATVCSRCQNSLRASHTLKFVEKDWHIALAIRCLQHLNSPLFQKHWGLSIDSEVTATSEDKDSERISTNQDHVQDTVAEAEKPSAEDGADSSQSLVTEGGQLSTEVPPQPKEKQLNPADENSAGLASKDGEVPEPSDHPAVSLDNDVDDNDSVVSEHDEVGFIDGLEDDPVSDGDTDQTWDWTQSRYEIDFWYDHMIRAQELCSNRAERDADESWSILMQELDKFTTDNEPAFNLWQKSFFLRNNQVLLQSPWKPIHIAAFLGLTSWAEHLLDKHNADPKEVINGCNALQRAAYRAESREMLQLLLEHEVDPNADTASVVPAFHEWLWTDASLETVQLFLRYKADPSRQNQYDQSSALYHFAAGGEDPSVLPLLLNPEDPTMKPDINATNKWKQTPLHRLLYRDSVPVELVKAFIEYEASVDAEDEDSERPLQAACGWGDKAVVAVLLENNQDVNDPDTSGRNAMHKAARGGFIECIDLLVAAGASAHAPDHHGRSPLFYASLNETEETAQHILGILRDKGLNGADINKATHFGQTPLRQASEKGLEGVVTSLLELLDPMGEGSSTVLNQADKVHGRTALHLAALRGHTGIVRQLVGKKADATLKDKIGKTPLELCTELWALTHNTAFEEIACLLVDANPENAVESPELAATAAMNGSKDVLERLQRAGAELNAPDRFGWSPLALARHFGMTEAEEFLRQQTAWAKAIPVRWVGAREGTSLSEDGLVVTHTKQVKRCISTERPLPSGLERYYFEFTSRKMAEVEQLENPIVAIGFCTHGASVLEFPGWPPKPFAPSARSWAYHGDDGGMFSNSPDGVFEDKSRRYKPGDTVGCGFDSKTRTIWFTRNGELMQPVYSNIQGRMFPVIGLQHTVELETNFGTKPFMWKGSMASNGVDTDEAHNPDIGLPDRTVKEHDDVDTVPGAE